ncbi:putative reverse transcriptase domain-containing protein, partial [Tanacetum coccineum]
FQLLKQKLYSAPILALPEGSEDFIIYCDASKKGLGVVLMQSGVRSQDLETLFIWNSKRGPEYTWEREDQFKKKYPHLFTKTTPSSSDAS